MVVLLLYSIVDIWIVHICASNLIIMANNGHVVINKSMNGPINYKVWRNMICCDEVQ